MSRLLSSFCIRNSGAGHASDRAELLRFLLNKGYDLDLAAVNARLETPLHCALRSRSLEILEVRTYCFRYRAYSAACVRAWPFNGCRCVAHSAQLISFVLCVTLFLLHDSWSPR